MVAVAAAGSGYALFTRMSVLDVFLRSPLLSGCDHKLLFSNFGNFSFPSIVPDFPMLHPLTTTGHFYYADLFSLHPNSCSYYNKSLLIYQTMSRSDRGPNSPLRVLIDSNSTVQEVFRFSPVARYPAKPVQSSETQ